MDWNLEGNSLKVENEPTETVSNLIRNSIVVKKGSLALNPDFGSEIYKLKRMKASANTLTLAKEYAKKSLEWLITAKKLNSVYIESSYDENNYLEFYIQATQKNKKEISFTVYYGVV